MKKGIIAIIIALSLSITLVIIGLTYKPSIHEATFYELTQVDEVGEVKATLILRYLTLNPSADIEELVLVNYVGEKTVRELKRRFR